MKKVAYRKPILPGSSRLDWRGDVAQTATFGVTGPQFPSANSKTVPTFFAPGVAPAFKCVAGALYRTTYGCIECGVTEGSTPRDQRETFSSCSNKPSEQSAPNLICGQQISFAAF